MTRFTAATTANTTAAVGKPRPHSARAPAPNTNTFTATTPTIGSLTRARGAAIAPQEAEALTEHAERLMVKYGIEQARIDEQRAGAGQSHEEIVEEQVRFSGVYARDIREMGAGIAAALGTLRPLYSDGQGGDSVLHLVGYASDAQQVKVLIASLQVQVQAMVAMRAWWAAERHRYVYATDSDRRRVRSGFVRGFGVGAAERIRDNRRAIIEESGTGTDLVLVSRRARVDDAAAAMSTRKARRRQGADANSFGSGRRSGLQANTGEKAVTRRGALPA